MNFLNLEYFLVAAEELNFTRAAKRLYISQQSLSNHIAKLEEYFQENPSAIKVILDKVYNAAVAREAAHRALQVSAHRRLQGRAAEDDLG